MNLSPTTHRIRLLTVILAAVATVGCQRDTVFERDPVMERMLQGYAIPSPSFPISDTGVPHVLDYSQYGEFQNVGQDDYRFKITNRKQLKADVGVGIYPNQGAVRTEENYAAMKGQGLLRLGHWDVLGSDNPQQAFFIWTTAHEAPGVKSFFTARILEEAGYILQAVKAYYATVVHFPRAVGWAADQSFVWYIAPAAMGEINRLCRDYPALNLEYRDYSFDVTNGGDTQLNNDIIKMNPGRFVTRTREEKLAALPTAADMTVADRRGKGAVQAVRYANGHWQLIVEGRPYFVRGVSYSPTRIGIGPQNDPNFDARWMFDDTNHNGIIDAPYESWVDANRNGRQDPEEPASGDFRLMQEMGVNTIRWYVPNKTTSTYDPGLVNKALLRDLYHTYGIRVMAGDFLGAYTQGSGATWEAGTDYTDPQQRALMKEIVRQKVLDLKDEPFLLMWVLGNENNMAADYTGINATRTNAASQPEAYARFLNEVAEMIHELDPDHPVAVGNIHLGLIDYYDRLAPAIDILGVNSYPGAGGFGVLFDEVRRTFDRPVLITEYGADAYDGRSGKINEPAQRDYHFGNLRDIILNEAGGLQSGNVIGGVVFQFVDEWWKDTYEHPVDEQSVEERYSMPFFDNAVHEEWFGVVGQGGGQHSPFERQLRAAYEMYREYWGTVPRQ